MTDAAFMLALLQSRPGEWVPQMEIIGRSIAERGHGMTPHSRAPELRAQGYTVVNKIEVHGGRRVSFYSLTAAADDCQRSSAAAVSGVEPDAAMIVGPPGSSGDRVDVTAEPDAHVLHPAQLSFEVAA